MRCRIREHFGTRTMTNCKNHKYNDKEKMSSCDLVPGIKFSGPGNVNHPCYKCQTQWTNARYPDIYNITQTIVDLQFRSSTEDVVKTESPDCFHLGCVIDRAYNGEPCACPNRWLYRCEQPDLSAYVPTTTLKQCRDCPFHEEI